MARNDEPLIKGCPFCGSQPVVGVLLPDGTQVQKSYAGCRNSKCLVRPSVRAVMEIGKAKAAVIKIWNKRFLEDKFIN